MPLQQLAADIQVSAPIGQVARAQNSVNFRCAKKIKGHSKTEILCVYIANDAYPFHATPVDV
jgi:hypothetical protein